MASEKQVEKKKQQPKVNQQKEQKTEIYEFSKYNPSNHMFNFERI